MSTSCTVTDLASYRKSAKSAHTDQEMIDDISARAFLYLRDEAHANGLSMSALIAEHMLGMALVMEAVEGSENVHTLLAAIGDRLGDDKP